MRFDRLQIPSFGPFTEFSYDFTAKAGRDLHIFYGNNEAGKSSLLRTISNLLYGIESRSKEDFIHSYAQLLIAADLSRNDGETLSVLRRKNPASKSLVTREGEVIADARWQAFLGHVDKTRFHSLFGLGAVELQQGNEVLLNSGGDLDSALAMASSGGSHLSEAIAAMEARADEHFKLRGKTTIRDLQDEIKQLNAQLKERTTRPAIWDELQQSIANCQTELDRIDSALLDLERALSRNERLQRGLEVVNDLRERDNEKAALDLSVKVPRGTAIRANDLISKKSQKVAEHERISLSLNQIKQQISSTLVQETLTRLEPEINHVVQHEKMYKADLAEVERLQSANVIREKELLLSSKSFGLSGVKIDEIETLRYQAQQLTACMDASDVFSEACIFLGQSVNNISGTRKHLAEIDTADSKKNLSIQQKVKALTEQTDDALQNDSNVKRLRLRLDELIGHQSKLQNLDVLQQEIDGYESEIVAAMQTLSIAKDSSSVEVSSLRVPLEKTIRDFEQRLSEQSAAIIRLQKQQTELADQATDIQLDIDSTRENADLPDSETLLQSRQQRDKLYKALQAENAAADKDYRVAVQHSDELADRLIASAESVVMLQQKELELSRVSARQKSVETTLLQQQESLANVEKAWVREWGIAADLIRTPTEMYEWREQWEKICHLQLSQAKAESKLLSDRAAVLASIRQLCEVLPSLNDLSGTADVALDNANTASLAETVSLVREEVSDSLREVDERSGASAKSGELKARYSEDLQQQQQEYTRLKSRAETALAQLVSSYSKVGIEVNSQLDARYVIAGIDPADVDDLASDQPVQADLLGLAVSSAREHLQERMGLVARYDEYLQAASELEEKNKSVEKFTSEVQTLSAEMGLDGSVEAAVFELGKNLNVNQRNSVRLDSLRDQLASQEASFSQSTTERAQSEKEYQDLLQTLGLEESTDLPALLPAIERFEELEKEIEATRRSLATHAVNQTSEEFIAEVGGRDPDDLKAERPGLEQQRSELLIQRDQLIEERTELNSQLRALNENSGEAADTQQLLNQAEASQKKFAVEFITLKLAANLLKSSVEEYREANRGPLFEEASALFRRLTGGSFLRINLDYSGDNKILIKGQREDGKNLGVEQMSDGTRDQLYLAMRLSALKLHLGNNEPMPLVVDDLLITFDDTRTAAALEVLAEIATQTQVLVFTHHERVMKIAVERFDARGSSFNELFLKKAEAKSSTPVPA